MTVAEPLNLQGWQLVDEWNRTFAGQATVGLRVAAGQRNEGQCRVNGGQRNTFDPDNGYRKAYTTIWTGN